MEQVGVAKIHSYSRWLIHAILITLFKSGVYSLIFNYGYRYLVDKAASGIWFYAITLGLGFILSIVLRKDEFLLNQFSFSKTEFTVQTFLGFKKTFLLSEYSVRPVLRKGINFPEPKAKLYFAIVDLKRNRKIREYAWDGFSEVDFRTICRLYGYADNVDFKL